MLWTDGKVLHDDMNGEALKFAVWPAGLRQATQADIDAIQNPPKTQAQIQADLELAVQNYLDSQAQIKGYDNIVSACSYASAPNPFQAEGISFLNWRAACWNFCYTLLAQVNVGTATIPTSQQLISMLPVRV